MALFIRLLLLLLAASLTEGLLLLPAGAQTRPAGSGQASPSTLRIPRVRRPPNIEDFLNGTPREAEATLTDFRQFRPGDGVPVSQPTAAYLSYDDKNLYVVFVCKDEPDKVRAHLAKREDIGNDEQVAIYLDTFHDHHRAYIFATNPLGIQLDGIFTEGQGNDFSFDTLWYSEGRLTADGYIVWMAIPFKSLRFPAEPAQDWGVALDRVIIRTNEVAFWPYVTTRVQGIAQQFATLEGLERISPGHNMQFIPWPVRSRPLSRHRGPEQPRVPHQKRFPRRTGRQIRCPRRAHLRRGAESGLQPGRIRRAAGHHQPAFRGFLPRKTAFLHRKRRILPDAHPVVLLTARCRSAVRAAHDRQGRSLGAGRHRDRRPRAGERQVVYRPSCRRPRRHRHRAGPARIWRAIQDRAAGGQPRSCLEFQPRFFD